MEIKEKIKVVVASMNPVKIACVQQAFESLWPDIEIEAIGVNVPSDVSDQPMTDEETMRGAKNRASNAKIKIPEADYWAGIEGGVENRKEGMEAFAWVVILSKNKEGISRTATFMLPPKIAKLVNQGVELGHADDHVFKRENSKQKDGAIGILTNGAINRAAYYKPAVMMALIPFLKEDYY